MNIKYDVFISYRRDGGYDTAKHLNDLLVRDGYKVSFDIDTLRNGDFDTQLLSRIEECKDFILIVDKHAFDRTLDKNFDPNKDWLRCELAHALKHNKNIIPIFLSGVTGFPEGLPADIVNVTKKNGPEYNRYYFNDFYGKLKSTFLTTRSRNKKIIYVLTICLLFIIFLCFSLFRSTPSIESVRNEIVVDNTSEINSANSIGASQNNDTHRYMTFSNIPMNMNIQTFSQRLEKQNYKLIKKDELNHYYEFENNNNRVKVYWDEQIDKVYMVEIVYSNFTKKDKYNVYYTFADEYGQEPTAFNEYLDGICFDEGAILFGLDSEEHIVVMYVDKQNSNNYRDL